MRRTARYGAVRAPRRQAGFCRASGRRTRLACATPASMCSSWTSPLGLRTRCEAAAAGCAISTTRRCTRARECYVRRVGSSPSPSHERPWRPPSKTRYTRRCGRRLHGGTSIAAAPSLGSFTPSGARCRMPACGSSSIRRRRRRGREGSLCICGGCRLRHSRHSRHSRRLLHCRLRHSRHSRPRHSRRRRRTRLRRRGRRRRWRQRGRGGRSSPPPE
jgi:hypothetical protein